jgi:LPXTG-motif cell wall-anchored protein
MDLCYKSQFLYIMRTFKNTEGYLMKLGILLVLAGILACFAIVTYADTKSCCLYTYQGKTECIMIDPQTCSDVFHGLDKGVPCSDPSLAEVCGRMGCCCKDTTCLKQRVNQCTATNWVFYDWPAVCPWNPNKILNNNCDCVCPPIPECQGTRDYETCGCLINGPEINNSGVTVAIIAIVAIAFFLLKKKKK